MISILVENSTWNNIGDAFYQYPLQRMIAKAIPEARVLPIDGPIVRAFRPGRFRDNALDVRTWYETAHYVLSGPILSPSFVLQYGDFVRHVLARGGSYSLLSVHSNASGKELGTLLKFLKMHPPRAVHTRDSVTFGKLKDACSCVIDGICFSFFVSQLSDVPTLIPPKPYVCFSFHSMPEPNIEQLNENEKSFDAAGVVIRQRRQGALAWRIRRHLDFRKCYPTAIGRWAVVRPVHGFYPFSHLSFGRSNSYASYNPLSFLSIYKSCEGVVTDRVHAGVAALSFGRPAHVVPLDDRYCLYDNAPIERRDNLFHLHHENFRKQLDRHASWLQNEFRFAIV